MIVLYHDDGTRKMVFILRQDSGAMWHVDMAYCYYLYHMFVPVPGKLPIWL